MTTHPQHPKILPSCQPIVSSTSASPLRQPSHHREKASFKNIRSPVAARGSHHAQVNEPPRIDDAFSTACLMGISLGGMFSSSSCLVPMEDGSTCTKCAGDTMRMVVPASIPEAAATAVSQIALRKRCGNIWACDAPLCGWVSVSHLPRLGVEGIQTFPSVQSSLGGQYPSLFRGL